MNWLRDKIRAWLGIEPAVDWGVSIDALGSSFDGEIMQIRIELDALKGEVRARNPEPQHISLRIVDDYETSQLKTLDEFRDPKKEN